jgi:hypothetical protein
MFWLKLLLPTLERKEHPQEKREMPKVPKLLRKRQSLSQFTLRK